MTSPTLLASEAALASAYDVALLDLDGVVYIGPHAVPGVPEALAEARALGMRLAFVTNNAARPPSVVADHLTRLGIAAQSDEVITSSQAAAHYLAERTAPAAKVLVVGTVGLHEALLERGLTPVTSADEEPVAVVQGYSPTLSWADLAEGAVAIGRGALWVATNVDPTVPSPRGPLPGNGSLVAALRHATGAEPIVTGKPDPTMHRESVERSHAERPIVVGDRLDTDVEGANAVGCPSLLVFSGVTKPRDVLVAPPQLRPSFLGHDAAALLQAHPSASTDGGVSIVGSWQAEVSGDQLRLSIRAAGTSTAVDDLDPLRALCAAAWGSARPLTPTGTGDAAAVLERLGLT